MNWKCSLLFSRRDCEELELTLLYISSRIVKIPRLEDFLLGSVLIMVFLIVIGLLNLSILHWMSGDSLLLRTLSIYLGYQIFIHNIISNILFLSFGNLQSEVVICCSIPDRDSLYSPPRFVSLARYL